MKIRLSILLAFTFAFMWREGWANGIDDVQRAAEDFYAWYATSFTPVFDEVNRIEREYSSRVAAARRDYDMTGRDDALSRAHEIEKEYHFTLEGAQKAALLILQNPTIYEELRDLIGYRGEIDEILVGDLLSIRESARSSRFMPPSLRLVPPDEAEIDDPQVEAERFLRRYTPAYVAVRTAENRAIWAAETDGRPERIYELEGTKAVVRAFLGNLAILRRVKELLDRSSEIDTLFERQLTEVHRIKHLFTAARAGAGQGDPVDLMDEGRRTIPGFKYCLERIDGECVSSPLSLGDIDARIRDLSLNREERLDYWEASKAVGSHLRPGLDQMRTALNGRARDLDSLHYLELVAGEYGLTFDALMGILNEALEAIRPHYEQVHCWAKRKLAARFGAQVPKRIPAHWLPNRFAQSWPGLVEGVGLDDVLSQKSAEEVIDLSLDFFRKMGFPDFPTEFFRRSDTFPAMPWTGRIKNPSAFSLHVDLGFDYRTLLNVVPSGYWFRTALHEFGHAHYYRAYSREEVPVLLRDSPGRALHEAIAGLFEFAGTQEICLRSADLLNRSDAVGIQRRLNEALEGAVVFLPFVIGVWGGFEISMYRDNLPSDRFDERWWDLAGRMQGISPPGTRPPGGCDACTKDLIVTAPGSFLHYALAELIKFQLHERICREVLRTTPHKCDYTSSKEVGRFIEDIMRRGKLQSWQEALKDALGGPLRAKPLTDYFAALLVDLKIRNKDDDCSF